MKETGICVNCDSEKAKNIVEESFKEKGFKVDYDGNNGVAEKGSKMMRMFFGGFADYYKIEFDVHTKKNDSVVNIKKRSSGISGGLVGASKAENMYNSVIQDLITKFEGSGIRVKKQ
ncbi:MAG: hypothetical protein JXA22_04705 [Candidatus Thermoplasmatota archaeon]|nr:hypothetical protein [Candidatus Thermoplasmatota archaeon]